MIADPVAVPEDVGLSSARLARIEPLFDTFINKSVIAGAVTLVARKGKIAHLRAHGSMDAAAGKAMRPDAIFRLASMTKPVIGVAIMQLLEEGKILLNDPISDFIPAFKNLQVAVPNPAAPGYVPTTVPTGGYHLAPAEREVTVRDLLTHTSGLGSATTGRSWEEWTGLLQSLQGTNTLADFVPRMASTSLSFQPGSAWEYSGVFGFDTLGHLVELVSGMSLDRYLQERIFEPLGMHDTTFHVPAARLSDVVTPYERGANGLQPGTPTGLLSFSTVSEGRYCSGGGGLAGTAEDYARFAMALCAGGELEGARILGRKTIQLMASNHVGDLPWDRPVGDLRGYRFGLSVRVLADPAEGRTMCSTGTFGWAGAYGTNSWIDPTEGIIGLMLIQRMPDLTDQTLRSLWPRYQNTVYQALD